MTESTVVLQGEDQTRMYQMLAQRRALKLEIDTGLKFSSKGSLAAHISAQHGLNVGRSKRAVLKALNDLIVQKGGPAL